MPITRDPHREARRNPRFRFESLVRVTGTDSGSEVVIWGRSTDLCQEGIGVTMGNSIEPQRLVRIDIPLPDRSFIAVDALLRYCNEDRCGFEFVDVEDQQRRAIRGSL